MTEPSAFVTEVANELATWPGVRIERRADGAAVVRYEQHELGLIYLDKGVAELPVLEAEHDELIEHGDAEEDELTPESSGVSHDVRGPSDVTRVLELFDRRYRDLRGDDDHYAIVHYGTDPKELSQTAKNSIRLNRAHPDTIFRARLYPLQPKTTYYYTVTSMGADGKSDGVDSPVNQFTTPAAGAVINNYPQPK